MRVKIKLVMDKIALYDQIGLALTLALLYIPRGYRSLNISPPKARILVQPLLSSSSNIRRRISSNYSSFSNIGHNYPAPSENTNVRSFWPRALLPLPDADPASASSPASVISASASVATGSLFPLSVGGFTYA